MQLRRTSKRVAQAAVLLVATSTAVRAQQTTYVSGMVYDQQTGGQDLHALLAAGSLSTQATLPGASASASIDASAGAAHMYVGTSNAWQSGTASAAFGYHVTLTNTGGPALFAPMQLFLDGAFHRTTASTSSGNAFANVIGRAWDINSGTLVSSVDLWLFADTPGVQQASDALLLPRPATVGGATTFRIDWSYSVSADDGWVADFQNTARIFFPTVSGISWTTADNVLGQQARPSWAQDQVVDFEVGTTTTPEPATLALLGGGLLALGALRRRVA